MTRLDSAIAHQKAATMEKEDRIKAVLEMVTPEEYQRMTDSLIDQFGLEFNYVSSHPFNIKAVIGCKNFTFAEGISPSSRTFMTLHSLGHYYFISSSNKKKVDRYQYLYDQRGKKTSLHIYDTQGGEGSLLNGRIITEQLIKDRTAFEVGANRFSMELLKHIGMGYLVDLVNLYQKGDINYILDVTAGGKAAIVPSDRDYLNRYICNNLPIHETTDEEKVFDPDEFTLDAIDWDLLSDINLEIHFF